MYPWMYPPQQATVQDMIAQHKAMGDWIKELKKGDNDKKNQFPIPKAIQLTFLLLALSPFTGPIVLHFITTAWHGLIP